MVETNAEDNASLKEENILKVMATDEKQGFFPAMKLSSVVVCQTLFHVSNRNNGDVIKTERQECALSAFFSSYTTIYICLKARKWYYQGRDCCGCKY